MKYIILLAIVAVQYNYPYAAEILASIIAVFGAIYYRLAFKLAAGLNRSELVVDNVHQVQSTTLSVLANGVAVVTLILNTPYAFIGWMAAPWIALTLMTMTMAWLMYFEYIEINPAEDDEE